MTYATIEQVAARLGRPITDPLEIDQVNAWLSDIEAAIRAGFRRAGFDLAAQVSAGEPIGDEVASVEASAAVRRIQNPTPGRTSRTESIDDGSVTDRWESSSDPWAITDTEWELLLPSAAPGAFSVRPSFQPDRGCHDYW
ncbi:Gp19/Gp15/Gp42 family protein [Rarobacter faecitabidus]|uniref:Gp19/Gp15/Gp42-like protein n=1 Tax=Rarobacter faecitabidus TaxID=13243 RepID=A0A542Z8C1_RARFA|nr:Gp19/Gp15/Gp42 family protein [Rarobacter faecitabidus]TQL56541.1 Gp19/Gp15/Gp42-like protein [Rarobacter faecitabidus]